MVNGGLKCEGGFRLVMFDGVYFVVNRRIDVPLGGN
jgi:hypothetical protein